MRLFSIFMESPFFKTGSNEPFLLTEILPAAPWGNVQDLRRPPAIYVIDLVGKGVSKRSLLIAFGGGSVGNITGLAAGLIFRGVRFVEVPTTITHQTDGMLSNKQAVNGKYGKK
jgi:hypothetical protein